jgi:hypothetical protein
VSPKLGLTFHPQLSSRDCSTCLFCIEDELIYVSSVYLDITLTVEEPAWIRSLTKASLNRTHYLAGIDSNDHSNAWGSPSNNPRGGLVEEILFEHGLCLLNKGNCPTFETARAATIIDITVASPALATLMSNWKVQQEMHLSDNHLFTVNLKVQPDLMPLHKGRNLKKADWAKFSRHIDEAYKGYSNPLLWSPAEID